MKVLIDMNLSPSWIPHLERKGVSAVHWSEVGNGKAFDSEVLTWARGKGITAFTNDLDFAAIFSATRAAGPSVIQVRTQDVSPHYLGHLVVKTLREYQKVLEQGALLTIDEFPLRARILSLSR